MPKSKTVPKPKKRVRQEAAVTRAQLLDATERLMVAEGYAAVTTRRVASMVGLTAALVHYYFPTTEDLLLAAYRRAAEALDERIRQALTSDRPLIALWTLLTDSKRMALGIEFMAMANHRKSIRTDIAQHDERLRRFLAICLSQTLTDAGITQKDCSSLCAATLIDGLARSMVMEGTLGISCGHEDAKTFIERMLHQIEKARKSNRTRRQAQGGPVRVRSPGQRVVAAG